MDAALFIIVEPDSAPADRLTQAKFTWAGVTEPQEPPVFHWGPYSARRDSLADWVTKKLPSDFRLAHKVTYRVEDVTLDLIERDANETAPIEETAEFQKWLTLMLSSSRQWALVFLWHWDEAGATRRGTPTEAAQFLRDHLQRDKHRTGFIYVHARE